MRTAGLALFTRAQILEKQVFVTIVTVVTLRYSIAYMTQYLEKILPQNP